MKTVSIVAIALLGINAAAFAQSSIEIKGAAISSNASSSAGSNDASQKKKPESNLPELPALVDATGKVAGPYVPSGQTVILRIDGALIAATVTNQLDVNIPFPSLGQQSGSTYRWALGEVTWFLSSDCSGPPIPLASAGLRPVAFTQDKRTGALTAYIGGTGLSTPKPANSVRQPSLGKGPQGGQCTQQFPFGGTIQGFDVEQTVVVSQRFPEPLTVR